MSDTVSSWTTVEYQIEMYRNWEACFNDVLQNTRKAAAGEREHKQLRSSSKMQQGAEVVKHIDERQAMETRYA